MPLTVLPTELVLQILSSLTQQDVARFSRTRKLFEKIAQATLYRSIVWRWHLPKFKRASMLFPRLYLLLRTFMESEGLGLHAKHLDFQAFKDLSRMNGTPTPYKPRGARGLHHDSVQAAQSLIQRFHLEMPGTCNDLLKRGRPDAYIALILAFLPNLSSLVWKGAFFSNSWDLFQQGLRSSSATSSMNTVLSYSQLRVIELGAITEKMSRLNHSHCLRDTSVLFHLPSITHLTIEGLPNIKFKSRWPSLLHSAPLTNLTFLRLKGSKASADVLEGILSSLPPLRHLYYDFEPLYDLMCCQDLGVLSQALRHVCDTLEILELHMNCYVGQMASLETFTDAGPLIGKIDLLHDCPRLFYLTIPFVVLGGWAPDPSQELSSLLPPSIQQVHLTDDLINPDLFRWTVTCCLEYMSELPGVRETGRGVLLPALQQVDLRLGGCDHSLDVEYLLAFKSHFVGAMMPITFDKQPSYPDEYLFTMAIEHEEDGAVVKSISGKVLV